MKVLVACEESQAVCKEFREKGHEAYSCDIQHCSGGHPEWHIMKDVIPLLNGRCSFETMDGIEHSIDGKWDMIIAHPPCTYLSNAGARWLYADGKLNEERYAKGIDGKKFFMAMLNADCPRIAVENPIPSSIYDLPKYTQIIQPYQFGEPWSKKTCLWLKGLDILQPTDIVIDHKPYCSSGSYSGTHDPKYKGASRKGGKRKGVVGVRNGESVQFQSVKDAAIAVNGSRANITRSCNSKTRKAYGYKWTWAGERKEGAD